MRFTMRIMTCLLLATALWLNTALAQDEQNEGVARVVLITPKAGQSQALLKAITDYHKWIAQFEGHHRYQWYEVLTGPDTGKYIARTGNHDWADFDASYDWQSQADENFGNNVMPLVEDIDIWFTTEMRDLSHWPDDMAGYTHFQVESWYVKSGQYGAFRRGLKKIVDTLKAGNFPGHWGVMSVTSGGYGNEMQLVMANRGWADMAEPDPSFFEVMSTALGGPEAFDAFMSDWGATFKSGPTRMVKYLPEASDYGED